MPGFLKYCFILLCYSLQAQDSQRILPDTGFIHPNSFHPGGNQIHTLRHERLEVPGLSEAITGGLLYLKQRQVSSDDYRILARDFRHQQGQSITILHYLRSGVSNQLLKEKHLEGSWPAVVSFIPGRGNPAFQPFFMATDYNSFITASTALCLQLFDESCLPGNKQFIKSMRSHALKAVEKFRRGQAYNFWLPGTTKRYPYLHTRPLNIPVGFVTLRKKVNDWSGYWGLPDFNESGLLTQWILEIHDKKLNPGGPVALFNIPDDSDDSSLALALQLLNYPAGMHDPAVIAQITAHRDKGRERADRFNVSLGKETGAYLTWHKEEELPVFSSPESGVLPLEVNNVDLVVNSNILLALSLAGNTTDPGYIPATRLLARAISEKLWKAGSVYYPEKLYFPYALSRAIREARLSISVIDSVLPCLIEELIREQKQFGCRYPELTGAFPAFDSVSTVMATALGLNALLNIGEFQAVKAGLVNDYRTAIDNSVRYLLDNAEKRRGILKQNPHIYWPSGPLFSSSVHDLAYWFSDCLTTGLVVEALAAYALGIDRIPVTLNPACLKLGMNNNKYVITAE